jgi:hypothetical protein
MHHINPDIDIIAQVIQAVLAAKPDDAFCKSIQIQYMERGNLSKKQLEGLHAKALRMQGINTGKLATLEAIIRKKHITHRSEVTLLHKTIQADEEAEKMIHEILEKFPQHKRVIFFKSNFEKNSQLIPTEKEELKKFYKILIKK